MPWIINCASRLVGRTMAVASLAEVQGRLPVAEQHVTLSDSAVVVLLGRHRLREESCAGASTLGGVSE